jgi:hypothetical protein
LYTAAFEIAQHTILIIGADLADFAEKSHHAFLGNASDADG